MYKGELEGFPPEIVGKMLYYQRKQGNKRDVTVFEEDKRNSENGFIWVQTEEGHSFWYEIIIDMNFNLFFERYPKSNNVVLGVTLEQGKDYYITTPLNYIVRFDKIENSKLFSICHIYLPNKEYDEGYENSFCNIRDIESIRLADPLESEHLSNCIKAGKYVEMEKKYVGEVVHCTTQEQWDFVIEKLSSKVQNSIFAAKEYGKNISYCIDINSAIACCDLEWYKRKNSLILSFEEWCEKFNHQFSEFKIGDWVVITKSKENWTKDMDEFINECVQITDIIKYDDTFRICFFNFQYWEWNYKSKHFRKALPHEIPLTSKKLSSISTYNVSDGFFANEYLYADQDASINPCLQVPLPDLDILLIKQEYKVEDGYLPYPEPIISLQLLLSQLND